MLGPAPTGLAETGASSESAIGAAKGAAGEDCAYQEFAFYAPALIQRCAGE